MEAGVTHIHLDAEAFSELLLEADQIEEARLVVEGDQQVEIAAWSGVGPRAGPEDGELADVITAAQVGQELAKASS